MRIRKFLPLIVSFLWIVCAQCIIVPLIPVGISFGFGSGYIMYYTNLYNKVKCQFYECCNDHYIPADMKMLDRMLTENLYGQQVAHATILSALHGHISKEKPQKALAMSFHGMPGSGKTYVATMIARALFKNGEKSTFYHFYNGRADFPHESRVEEYKVKLQQDISANLVNCETSLFVFDEVDKMPAGVLDALVPFLDYNRQWSQTSRDTEQRKAIYIFLSNTGSTQITKRLISLWKEGRKRETATLTDFENIVILGAFNERGGFYRSDAIDSSLIDHYVPFLPLEETHVKLCWEYEFKQRGITPTAEMMEEAMMYATFGPPPYNLYSNAGCKRVHQKAATIVYKHMKQKNLEL